MSDDGTRLHRGACRSCGADVLWVRTTGGKLMPLNPGQVENGNVELRGNLAVYVDPRQPSMTKEPRYVSHFATCPQAPQWRRK